MEQSRKSSNIEVCHILAGEVRFNKIKESKEDRYNLYLSWGKAVAESSPHGGQFEK